MANEQFLAQLWATIESRKAEAGPEKSYTRELLANPSKARKKVAEEAYEVNEAHQALLAGKDSKDHLAHEAADLLYHLFVVLASADVTPSEVYAVLEKRHGTAAAGRADLGQGARRRLATSSATSGDRWRPGAWRRSAPRSASTRCRMPTIPRPIAVSATGNKRESRKNWCPRLPSPIATPTAPKTVKVRRTRAAPSRTSTTFSAT